MHVVFVSPAFPPFIGGGERYAESLATGLAACGHRVTVLTSAAEVESDFWQGSSQQEGGHRGPVQVLRCPIPATKGGWVTLQALRKLMVLVSAAPGSHERLLMSMARRFPPLEGFEEQLGRLDDAPDLVHGFNISWEFAACAGWRFARRTGVPFAMTPFAHLGDERRGKVALNSTMQHQRRLMNDADVLFSLTQRELEGLAARGIRPKSTAVIGAPFESPLTAGRAEDSALKTHGISPPFVLFVGRLSADKGAMHAVQAIIRLRQMGTDVSLVLIGRRTEAFRRFYDRLGEADRAGIRPLGQVSEADKHAFLSHCKLLTLPSRSDSFGIVLLEAWSHGKSVVAARSGGIPGVVDDGVNGLLVSYGDVEGLAQAIASILQNQDLGQKLGRNGRRKLAAEFDKQLLIDRLLAAYNETLGA